MELAVVIEPLPGRQGFTARVGPPLNLSAEGATAAEAHQQVAELLRARMQQGVQLRTIHVPIESGAAGGWLPDDELTREWLQHVEQYRAECDAAERRRLLGEVMESNP